jgi:hypothetical protein
MTCGVGVDFYRVSWRIATFRRRAKPLTYGLISQQIFSGAWISDVLRLIVGVCARRRKGGVLGVCDV